MAEPFFRELAPGRVIATPACSGPWDPRAQHGGPPAALLGREVERLASWPGTVVRVTCEILGPVPLGELTLSGRVTRPGRSVELVEAELATAARTVMTARAWRVRTADGERVAPPADPSDPLPPPPPPLPPPPAEARKGAARPASVQRELRSGWSESELLAAGWGNGYLASMQWSFVHGRFDHPGSATVWGRPRVALVEGEQVSPLSRVLLLADSGNGISSVLDLRRWLFINPELSVHLVRYPRGEWLCVQARTALDTELGTGLAESRLWDADGPLGRGAQSLLVTARPG